MNFTFDRNEWFVVVSSVVVMFFFLRIRKHFRPMVIFVLWVYTFTLVATIDYAIAATPFHVYDCLDNETYEPMAAFSHLFVYAPFSFIFLYYYDKWAIRGKRLIVYLAAWTILSLTYEWLSLKFGFLNYSRGWKMIYSIPTYPLAALVLLCVYRFVKKNLASHPYRYGE